MAKVTDMEHIKLTDGIEELFPAKRDVLIGVKVTRNEKDEFQHLADALGVSISKLIRHLLQKAIAEGYGLGD